MGIKKKIHELMPQTGMNENSKCGVFRVGAVAAATVLRCNYHLSVSTGSFSL